MEDKDFIWPMIMVLSLIILLGSFAYFDYKKAEKELSQPKYFIEFNNELYELKKVN